MPPPEYGPQWLRIAALPPSDRAAECAAVVEAEFKTALMMNERDELPAGENLFDLGLTSLRAVEAKERLEAAFGRRIDISDLFDQPTVRGLAAHLTKGPLADLFPVKVENSQSASCVARAEEQPAEEQPAEEQPAEEQPAEEPLAQEQLALNHPAADGAAPRRAQQRAAVDDLLNRLYKR